MSSNDVTVVLAHGAWADGSSWAKVIGSLVAEGIKVVAAPMPLGIVRRPRGGREKSNASARDGAGRSRRPRLCRGRDRGHREREGEGNRYVAALAPDEGETVADVFYRTEPHPQAPKLAPDDHGLIYLPEPAFAAAFGHAAAEEQTLLATVQRPISTACITVAVDRPLWKDRPSWFLVAEEDRMIVPETQRFMATRMKARVRSHQVDHTPIVTAPGVVVEIIRDAVHDVATRQTLQQ